MKSFFHIVSYIDLYEDNLKLHNVGFLKWDYRNNAHYIEISLKDVKPENGIFMIEIGEGGYYLDKIKICEGRGLLKERYIGSSSSITVTTNHSKNDLEVRPNGHTYDKSCQSFIINEKEISLEGVEKIKIKLDERKYLCAKLTMPVEKKLEIENISIVNREKIDNLQLKEEISTESRQVIHKNCGKLCEIETSNVENQIIDQEKQGDNQDKNVEKYGENEEYYVDKVENSVDKTENKEMSAIYEGNYYVEKQQNEGMKRENEEVRQSPVERLRVEKPLPEDKWNQLCLKYNVVHPFPDQEGFLTITLKDFIILQEGYQKLVHNSFLLHGYYNYGHVILGGLKEEKDKYYIGVPGVYYEQEKKAARMFGFVGFEGVEKIVENGSYGYYMIEVKL